MVTVYYHGDADGVCSAALVARKFGRVKFVPVLRPSELESRVKGNDFSFILDLAPTQTAVDKIGEVVVVDHHVAEPLANCVHLNPRLVGQPAYPASYLCYSLFGGQAWIALTGTINDWGLRLVPDLVAAVSQSHPKFITKKTQEEVYLNDPVGRLGRSIDALIATNGEDGASVAVKLVCAADSPFALLKQLRGSLEKIEKEIMKVLATPKSFGNLVFLEVRSRYPVKSQVIQRLKLDKRFVGKTLLVAQRQGGKFHFSLRSDKVDLTALLKKALKGLAGDGGGHPAASGGWVAAADFERFLERLIV